MKTDSIFYRLFKIFPTSFFELINRPSSDASNYEFSSVELKQTAFRIDGVFLPVDRQQPRPIYFLEVQFQKDPELYARFFCEIFLYLRLYAPTKPWKAVVVFARRSMEPTEVEPYRVLLESSQVTRLYLNELGDAAEQSVGIGIVKLIVETKKQTPQRVRQLVEKAREELADETRQREVLDLIETMPFKKGASPVLYKLPRVSRQELARMFGLNELKKTRYYQEVREEVREETVLELIMRLLSRRIGAVNPQLQERIRQLSVSQLENLAEALLEFSSEADLAAWLNQISTQSE